MNRTLRNVLLHALLAAFPVSALAQQAGVSLSIGTNAAGQVTASYSAQIPPCGVTANGEDPSVSVIGTMITVTQPLFGIACVTDPPPYRVYQRTVSFGALIPGNYTLDWNFPPLTTTFTVSAPPRAFAISPGITGNWFDASASGQGFALEVLADNSLLAEWHTFAPLAAQAWIIAMGSVDGDSAVLQAYQAVGPGGRFPPNFDAAQLQSQYWGTLTFTFGDCNNGTVSWDPVVPGYASGSMSIERLTMPAGVTCR